MVDNFFAGNITKATELQINSIPLTKALFCEVNPIPVKAALSMVGFDFGKPRLPLVEITEENKKILKKELQKRLAWLIKDSAR